MRYVEEIVDKKLELRRSKVSYVCETDDPKAMPTVSKSFAGLRLIKTDLESDKKKILSVIKEDCVI